jgi:hypothetical protein
MPQGVQTAFSTESMMDRRFARYIEDLSSTLEALLSMLPVTPLTSPKSIGYFTA